MLASSRVNKDSPQTFLYNLLSLALRLQMVLASDRKAPDNDRIHRAASGYQLSFVQTAVAVSKVMQIAEAISSYHLDCGYCKMSSLARLVLRVLVIRNPQWARDDARCQGKLDP